MIYVHGIKLPKDGEHSFWLVIHSDGTVEYNENKGLGWQMTTAVPVLPHGRLIDETDARKAFYSVYQDHGLPWQNAEVILEVCKTIIPAEEGEA